MKAEGREVAAVGGLHIIGTERHESRRIDNQLRGRAGRQGDPGSSRFFLSLEDDLMRKFAGEWVSAVLTRLGMQEGEAIESKMVSRRIEGAQKKVEERNFDIRKNLLEYDEVMDEQRKRVYSFRQSLLEGAPPKEMILEMIDSQIAGRRRPVPRRRLRRGQLRRVGRPAAGRRADRPRLQGRRASRTPRRSPRTKAERQLAETIRQAIEENLPADADPSEWTWQALANWANARFGLNLKDQDLRKYRRHRRRRVPVRPRRPRGVPQREGRRVAPEGRPRRRRASSSCPTGAAARSAAGSTTSSPWPIDPASWAELDRAEIVRRIQAAGARPLRPEGGRAARCGSPCSAISATDRRRQTPRYDREGLAAWASSAITSMIDAEELRPMLRPEIEATLIDLAHSHYQGAKLAEELEAKLAAAKLAGSHPRQRIAPPPDPAALADLAAWASEALGLSITADDLQAR